MACNCSNDFQMGVYGLPGTFPTGLVVDMLNDMDPLIKTGEAEEWTRDQVHGLYFHYRTGVIEGGFTSYDKAEYPSDVIDWMELDSSLPRNDISAFFTVLEHMTNTKLLDPRYIEVIRPSGDPFVEFSEGAKKGFNMFGDVTTMMKWGAILGVSVVGFMTLGPIIKSFSKKG